MAQRTGEAPVSASYGRVVRRFAVNKFKNKLHYHGCDQCRLRYSCSCDMPGVDVTCSTCKGGHPESSWQAANKPRACCQENTRRANDADRDMYKLAGPGPWWVCTHCWRQQPINPQENNHV